MTEFTKITLHQNSSVMNTQVKPRCTSPRVNHVVSSVKKASSSKMLSKATLCKPTASGALKSPVQKLGTTVWSGTFWTILGTSMATATVTTVTCVMSILNAAQSKSHYIFLNQSRLCTRNKINWQVYACRYHLLFFQFRIDFVSCKPFHNQVPSTCSWTFYQNVEYERYNTSNCKQALLEFMK